jgi:hypothetical protein
VDVQAGRRLEVRLLLRTPRGRKAAPASARESRDYADFALVRTVFDYKGRPKGSRDDIDEGAEALRASAMNRKKGEKGS